LEYIGFVWRSSASFDEYDVVVDAVMTGVEEVIVKSGVSGGARVLSAGSTSVSMSLGGGSSSWTRVWGASLGEGSYSLDGLHVKFAKQDVHGIRLSSSPFGNPSFDGWGDVVMHFGRAVGSGSVRVSASSVLEAVAGDSVSVESASVSVAAGGSLDVSGDSVSIASEDIQVLAASTMSLQAGAATIDVHEHQGFP
jgi:hypothetical protein